MSEIRRLPSSASTYYWPLNGSQNVTDSRCSSNVMTHDLKYASRLSRPMQTKVRSISES